MYGKLYDGFSSVAIATTGGCMGLVRLPGFPDYLLKKEVFQRIKASRKWHRRSDSDIANYVLAKVLNAISKGTSRGQNEARVRTLTEPCFKSRPSEYFEKVERACFHVDEIVSGLGYKVAHIREYEKDKKNEVMTSSDGRVILSLSLHVKELQEQSLDTQKAVRSLWNSTNKLLPVENKRPAYKKKKK